MKKESFKNISILLFLIILNSCKSIEGTYVLDNGIRSKTLVLEKDRYELSSDKKMGMIEYSEGKWILKNDIIYLFNSEYYSKLSFSFNVINDVNSDSCKICGEIIPVKLSSSQVLFKVYKNDSSIEYYDFYSDSCVTLSLKDIKGISAENIQTQESLYFIPHENKIYKLTSKSFEYSEYDTIKLIKEKELFKDLQTAEYFIKIK